MIVYRNGVPTVVTGWRAWLIMLGGALAFVAMAVTAAAADVEGGVKFARRFQPSGGQNCMPVHMHDGRWTSMN